MRFYIKNEETDSRWEFEIDLDASEFKKIIKSDDWMSGPKVEFITEDWIQRKSGFDVFGLNDDELESYVVEIKSFFEEQEIDADDIEYFEAGSDEDVFADEPDEDDLFSDMFRDTDYF